MPTDTSTTALQPGAPVVLHCPENLRLHGQPATILALTDWGAIVQCPAAATGYYRALYDEMIPADGGTAANQQPGSKPAAADAVGQEYSGDCCTTCGSVRMQWAGACRVCLDCGSSGGCS